MATPTTPDGTTVYRTWLSTPARLGAPAPWFLDTGVTLTIDGVLHVRHGQQITPATAHRWWRTETGAKNDAARELRDAARALEIQGDELVALTPSDDLCGPIR